MTRADIFTDLNDFAKYAPGIDASTDIRQLEPHIKIITSEIFHLITPAAYLALRSTPPEDTEASLKEAWPEGLELLKTAVASGTLYKYQIFITASKAGSEAALYKYQHEEIKRAHLDAYWSALDELLEWLDSHPTIGGFADSYIRKERQELPVSSAAEFDRYFQIDRSAYFFSRIQYLIREQWIRLKRIVSMDDEEMAELAKRALCYRVMARVVMTFDVTEWPKCIRYDFNHEYTKGSDIQERRTLAGQFTAEAEANEQQIATLQSRKMGAGSRENQNTEDSKHYFTL